MRYHAPHEGYVVRGVTGVGDIHRLLSCQQAAAFTGQTRLQYWHIASLQALRDGKQKLIVMVTAARLPILCGAV